MVFGWNGACDLENIDEESIMIDKPLLPVYNKCYDCELS